MPFSHPNNPPLRAHDMIIEHPRHILIKFFIAAGLLSLSVASVVRDEKMTRTIIFLALSQKGILVQQKDP